MTAYLKALVIPLLCLLQPNPSTLNTYQVTLESIKVVKAGEAGNDKELYGSIWAGAFCAGQNQQPGNSLDTRERSFVLFERKAENYVRVHEGQALYINKSLTFDASDCPGGNLAVQVQLNDVVESTLEKLGNLTGNDGAGVGCPSEKLIVYFNEVKKNIPLRKTLNCYNRSVHMQLTFIISQV